MDKAKQRAEMVITTWLTGLGASSVRFSAK